MEPLIADSVSRLLLKFEKAADSGKSVNVFEYFGRYTMEVILASAFGRHKDIQSTEERDKLTDAADAIFVNARDSAGLVKWLCELHVATCHLACLSPYVQHRCSFVAVQCQFDQRLIAVGQLIGR